MCTNTTRNKYVPQQVSKNDRPASGSDYRVPSKIPGVVSLSLLARHMYPFGSSEFRAAKR